MHSTLNRDDAGSIPACSTIIAIMKRCAKCKTPKALEEFNADKSRKDGRGTFCRECNSAYLKEHYKLNKPYYKAKRLASQRKYRKADGERIIAYLREHPCVDCGEADIIVLDFDHDDPLTKIKSVASMMGAASSWPAIEREIKKCTVRCANCHRRRTARQCNSYRLVAQQEERESLKLEVSGSIPE